MDLFTQIKMAVSVKEAVSLVRQRSDRHAEAADDAASGGAVRYLRLELPCADAHGGRGRRSGSAETEGVSARQVRIGKKFARRRNHSTKPRCLEPCTSFTDGRAPARFGEKAHSSEKPMSCTCEECIECGISNGFGRDRTFHQTAKLICKSVHQLRCFHIKNSGRIL